MTIFILLLTKQKRPLATVTPKGRPRKVARVEAGKSGFSLFSLLNYLYDIVLIL